MSPGNKVLIFPYWLIFSERKLWKGSVSWGQRTLSSGSDPQRGKRAEGCLNAPLFLKEDLLTHPSITVVYPLPGPCLPLIIFTFFFITSFFLFINLLFLFILYLAPPHHMQDVNSPTMDETDTPCGESRVLTTGLPGKSHKFTFFG